MLALCREQRLEHRTKHIALRYFVARELQQRGQLRLAYVASKANTADVFTKALAPCGHQRCCTQLERPTHEAAAMRASPGFPPRPVRRLGGYCCPTLGPAVGAPTAPTPLGLAAPPESAPLESAPPESVPPDSAPPEPSPPVSAPPVPVPPGPAFPVSSPPVSPPPKEPVPIATGCRGGEDDRGGKPGGVSERAERQMVAVSSAVGSPLSWARGVRGDHQRLNQGNCGGRESTVGGSGTRKRGARGTGWEACGWSL
ncbi:unnamed protein product [Closterium sp. NIES-54]